MTKTEMGRVFNNADSFAMAFDLAWEGCCKRGEINNLSTDEKLTFVLKEIKEHPFYISSPSTAIETAKFRIKLLNRN